MGWSDIMTCGRTRAAKVTEVWSLVPCEMTMVVKVPEGMVNEAITDDPMKKDLERLQEDEGGKGYRSMELGPVQDDKGGKGP